MAIKDSNYVYSVVCNQSIFYSLPLLEVSIETRTPLNTMLLFWSDWINIPSFKYFTAQQPDTPFNPTQCAYLQIKSGENSMGFEWVSIQKSISKLLASDVPVL